MQELLHQIFFLPPEVRHDLLRPAEDGGELGAPLEPLHDLPHPRRGDGPPAENLARLVHHLPRAPRAEVLQQRDRPRELRRLFLQLFSFFLFLFFFFSSLFFPIFGYIGYD